MKFKSLSSLASIAFVLLLASCTPSISNNRPSSSPTNAQVGKTDAKKLNIFGSNLAVADMGNKVTPFSPSIPMPEMMMSRRMQ